MLERCRLRGNDNFCVDIKTRPIVPSISPTEANQLSKKPSFICSPLSLLSSYADHGETDSDEILATKEMSPKSSPKGLSPKSSPKRLTLKPPPRGFSPKSSMMSVVSSKDSKSDYESDDNITMTQQCILPSNKLTNRRKRTIITLASANPPPFMKRNRRENTNSNS